MRRLRTHGDAEVLACQMGFPIGVNEASRLPPQRESVARHGASRAAGEQGAREKSPSQYRRSGQSRPAESPTRSS
jgi:hypothetical protein